MTQATTGVEYLKMFVRDGILLKDIEYLEKKQTYMYKVLKESFKYVPESPSDFDFVLAFNRGAVDVSCKYLSERCSAIAKGKLVPIQGLTHEQRVQEMGKGTLGGKRV